MGSRPIRQGSGILICLVLAVAACQFFEEDNMGGGPLLPLPYLDVSLQFEHLPGYLHPAEITFLVTVIGDSGRPVITWDGDTLDYLWLSLETSMWLETVDADPDSLWSGKYSIGQEILLKPKFQMTNDSDRIWSTIGLIGTFFPADSAHTGRHIIGCCLFTGASLFFNHVLGQYSFSNPAEP